MPPALYTAFSRTIRRRALPARRRCRRGVEALIASRSARADPAREHGPGPPARIAILAFGTCSTPRSRGEAVDATVADMRFAKPLDGRPGD
jgi:hypothetical protein